MNNNENLSGRAYIAIGLMLFALFFGAGNLIFPASLGQQAGSNVWYAIFGFILTGVGLPLLGVLAMGYSGCGSAAELAKRVSPLYGTIFTVLLYLSIGPAFAIPRTGTVSYEIALRPFLGDGANATALAIFLFVFLATALYLSINPQKLVDRIGKVLTPILLIAIAAMVIKSLLTPMGTYQAPINAYATPSLSIVKGFLEGYNTLDALAALVFGILVIDFVKLAGATSTKEITSSTAKAGVIAVTCLAFVYIFIANIGATSVEKLGILDTGAPILAESAKFFYGDLGSIIIAIIVLLACLTTSIGLISSCSAYFSSSIGGLSYKGYAVLFTVISFCVGTFGLKTIITAAIPVLMFLYPQTIVLILLAFLHKSFGGRQCVYAWTMGLTFIISLVNGLETAGVNVGAIASHVPFYDLGLGWIPFALVGFLCGLIHKSMVKQ